MSSWVRYSITAYVGLLISGALAHMPRQAPADEPTTHPSAQHHAPSNAPPAMPDVTKPTSDDASV